MAIAVLSQHDRMLTTTSMLMLETNRVAACVSVPCAPRASETHVNFMKRRRAAQ
jgi:hypothetical protein